MKVIKEENEFGMTVYLKEKDKYLAFFFGGNLDLYIILRHQNELDNSIVITKENYSVYKLFNELFNDIDNINIFDIQNKHFKTKEEKDIFYKNYNENIERKRIDYKLNNISNYNELFDKETNTITWYSDETGKEVSNVLKI